MAGVVGLMALGVGVGVLATSSQTRSDAVRANQVSLVLGGASQLALGVGLVVGAIAAADLPAAVGMLAWGVIVLVRIPIVFLLRRTAAGSGGE